MTGGISNKSSSSNPLTRAMAIQAVLDKLNHEKQHSFFNVDIEERYLCELRAIVGPHEAQRLLNEAETTLKILGIENA